ncbi:hypothetical protein ACJMK2_016054 [Sinanodonta woodiana]|uniref:Uncharacterized protein n=1 Tax=Sinanodonta woodiana TaxID=1069815 RepID=A0ABD3UVH0_SINWO
MGCGPSKSDDGVHRVTSPHVDVVHRVTSPRVKKELKKRKNSAKSTSSSSSSSSDDSKDVNKKEKKKKGKKNKVVSPVIKANEDDILNNDNQKPLTPKPKSASSRGSITRKSSSSGFSEHEKDASSIDPNEVERNAYDEEGERETKPVIFSIGSNDKEDTNETHEDTELANENVTDITDGGEENQEANDVALSKTEIIAGNKEDEEDNEDNEDNTDGISGNNENSNDMQQSEEQQADDDDLGIYEDNGNNDIDDENGKTQGFVGNDDLDDTEQQMNDENDNTEEFVEVGDFDNAEQQMSEGEDVPDTYIEPNDNNDTEHNKSTEPSHEDVALESNDNYDISDGANKSPTPRSESESEAEEDGLDIPDTFRMELNINLSGMHITSS